MGCHALLQVIFLTQGSNPHLLYLLHWQADIAWVVKITPIYTRGLPRWHSSKNLPANAGNAKDVGLIPGSGRSPKEGNSNPLQYSCLDDPMDRKPWRATVHGVAKSQI